MKNKFAFLIDILFLGFVVFTISLVLLNFFTPHPYSVIYALCISSLSLIFFYKRQNPKRKGELVKRKEQKELTALMAELNFSDRQQQNSLIEKGLKTAKYSPERRRGVILLKEQSAVILCRFGFTKVSKADVVRAYNLINKEQTAYILAESFDLEVLSFAERFNKKVVLVAGEKIYKFLKEFDCIPNEYKYKSFFERKNKASIKTLLDKKKSKTFFVFGLLFLLFSYISPLKVYYIVCGCIFLIYSLVLRLLGKNVPLNTVKVDNI